MGQPLAAISNRLRSWPALFSHRRSESTVMKSLRLRFFLSHLAISATVVGAAITFIAFVWYPPPLAQLEGIFKILLVMAGVDVCAGPLCTLVVASPNKSRRRLARDLAVIGAVQLAALGYA